MRFLILSDLHLETAPYAHRSERAYDAVILAGDLHESVDQTLRWLGGRRSFSPAVPILYVPGNHEYYGGVYQWTQSRLRTGHAISGLHVLAPGEVILDSPSVPGQQVRVLGTTLWTDFQLPVQVGSGASVDRERALRIANERMDDFYCISLATDELGHMLPEQAPGSTRERSFRAEDSLALHEQQRRWLESRLAEPFNGKTVVVTHHAPAVHSVAAEFVDDWLSPAFASDLPTSLFEVPTLWVHGHTHTAVDYRIGACRIVCNPRGYASNRRLSDTSGFDPDLVIELR